MSGVELLTTEQMYRADALAMQGGTPGPVLMENAGRAVAQVIQDHYAPQPVLVLCGPGNNGGDGFVIARILQRNGWPVRLALLGPPDRLHGDAADMAARWTGEIEPLSADCIGDATLVVDALFGAGLDRPVEGVSTQIVDALNGRVLPVVAVDVPSGLDGDTGRPTGPVVHAAQTVTFFRKKPAHVLMPGRVLCGHVHVMDIGIPDAVLNDINPAQYENDPLLWASDFPWPQAEGHKYTRGHGVVVSGPLATSGAARLAARAALRIGAGLVTVACPPSALIAHTSQLNAVMTRPFGNLDDILADTRKNAFVLGPGGGVGEQTRENVLKTLHAGRSCVLDADALTSFAEAPDTLFDALDHHSVLTPHEGEFARLFPDVAGRSRLDRARAAAAQAGAIVVLKGPDTVIAHPDGALAINTNAPPTLATAGSGDVLAGFIMGLLAQGMPSFSAACAAVWLHGRAGALFGPGLIAEDLSETLPQALADLRNTQGASG